MYIYIYIYIYMYIYNKLDIYDKLEEIGITDKVLYLLKSYKTDTTYQTLNHKH